LSELEQPGPATLATVPATTTRKISLDRIMSPGGKGRAKTVLRVARDV
jgi:hypothetical protein